MIIEKSERLKDYIQCIEFLKSVKVGSNTEIGICVILGNIRCGGYFMAPWDDWKDVVDCYPELKETNKPETRRACETNNIVLRKSLNERIKIIELAISKIE